MVIISLFLTWIDVYTSSWKHRPQGHSIPIQGKYEMAKCCPRLECNTLCLSRAKANAKGDNICGWWLVLLQQCPALCWKKASFVLSSCQRFLRELGNVANITIWSSMVVATAKFVCDLLFKNLPNKPINILGQESCERIWIRDTSGKVSFFKIKGTGKPMTVKIIQKELFFDFNGRNVEDNTIVVDDNPPKHMLIPSENVILPETWTFAGAG